MPIAAQSTPFEEPNRASPMAQMMPTSLRSSFEPGSRRP